MSLHHLYQLILTYRYPILIVITILEGPVVSIFCGFLLRLGYIALLPTYLCLMAGDLIGDIALYLAGYSFGHHFVRWVSQLFGIDENKVEAVKQIFHEHKNKILFISKVTMGFGFGIVILFTAGIVKIPFKRYMAVNTVGQLVWTGFLLIVGFFFGHLYTLITSDTLKLVFVLILAIVVITAFKLAKRFIESKTVAPAK